MAANEYTNISFRVAGGKKDLRHIIQLGADYNVDMSIHRTMLSNFDEVERLKGDDLDITSVVGGKLQFELYIKASELLLIEDIRRDYLISCTKQIRT